jgi:hypothetical protein
VSLSDRFRRGPSDGEDIPSVDSSRVLDNLGSTEGLGAVGPDQVGVAEESEAAAALVAPPIAAGDDAPWRSKGRSVEDEAPAVEMTAPADAVAGEATIVDEVTADEAGPEDADDAVAAEDDAVATAVVDDLTDTEVDDESLTGAEVDAAGDSLDSDEAVIATPEREWSTGEAGFKPWESPMSSGFESTLESLNAAMTSASDTDTDTDTDTGEAIEPLELAGAVDEAAEAADATVAAEDHEEIAENSTEDTDAVAAGAEAAPAAPPLASPAFGRSQFGAV